MGVTALCKDFSYKVNRPLEYVPNQQALGLCYLPIVGVHAVSLYNFLVNDSDVQAAIPSVRFMHSRLAQSIGVNAEEIETLRSRLEAMSLLATYVDGRDPTNPVVFYELRQPLSIASFIDTPRFKALLEQKIGSVELERVAFASQQRAIPGSAVNVSSTFDTVFAGQILTRENLVMADFAADLSKKAGFPIGITAAVWPLLNNLYVQKRVTYSEAIHLAVRSATKIDGNYEVQAAMLISKADEMADFANLPAADVSKITRDVAIFEGDCDPQTQSMVLSSYRTKNAELYLTQLQACPLSCKDRSLLNVLRITMGMADEAINALVDFATQRSRGRLNAEYVKSVAKSMRMAGVRDAHGAVAFFREVIKGAKGKARQPVKRAITAESVMKQAKIPSWLADYDPSNGQTLA